MLLHTPAKANTFLNSVIDFVTTMLIITIYLQEFILELCLIKNQNQKCQPAQYSSKVNKLQRIF